MGVDVRPAYLTLLRECFFGMPEGQDGTWFVQGKEGIFDALDSVDSGRASHRPMPGSPTIAAHAFHILYILRVANASVGGTPVEGTWESSWDRQEVAADEWRELREQIRRELDSFIGWVTDSEWPGPWSDPEESTGLLAHLPHMAYHLGAIRQLMRF